MKKRLAFFEIEDWEKEYITKAFPKADIKFFSQSISKANVSKVKDCDTIAVFIYSQVTKEILDKLPKVKLIATMSTGFDHIDLEECKKRKITVANVPYYGENTVAEHTFALILALSRKIYPSIERTKLGSFELEGLRGFDLKGKTLGIVGCGHIGEHVARMAFGFEMKILIYDIKKDPKLVKNFKAKYVSLNTLLKQSDIISLHAPLNPRTKHLINKQNIKLIKSSALIINTARGGLIETTALANALTKKKIAGAGLDVLEEECAVKEERQLLSAKFAQACNLKTIVENHILQRLDNVIVTPHNAFNSDEALMRILDTSIDNISGFFRKKKINRVE